MIVTATGLNLLFLGGMEIVVDGEGVDVSKLMTYKGMMLNGIPNFVFTLGYTNASWTLKADLTSEYVCRLLNHMDAHGYSSCVPEVTDPSVTEEPVLDFTSGYVLRALDNCPNRARRSPGSCGRTTWSTRGRSATVRSMTARCSSPHGTQGRAARARRRLTGASRS